MTSSLQLDRPFSLRPYVQIARMDHWFKNAFMLLGVMLAFFYEPALMQLESIGVLTAAFFITCIVASSNYVLNEWLDAPLDRLHPTKKNRPAARGEVDGTAALALWGVLGLIGIVGALVGGLVLRTLVSILGWLSGLVGAVLGALLVIWLWQKYGPRR